MAESDRTWYVFALADPGLPPTFRVLGHTLHRVSLSERIDAVGERRAARIEPTTDALRAQHDIVTRLAARAPGLLPARFGSLVDEGALRKLVSDRQAEILGALERVRGRCQMTIRVFGARDSIPVEEQRPSTGTAFLASRRARAHQAPGEVQIIRDALRSITAAERVEPGEGGLRVSVYHLISKEDVGLYKQQARTLRITPHRVIVSGPWPAFAFAPELF